MCIYLSIYFFFSLLFKHELQKLLHVHALMHYTGFLLNAACCAHSPIIQDVNFHFFFFYYKSQLHAVLQWREEKKILALKYFFSFHPKLLADTVYFMRAARHLYEQKKREREKKDKIMIRWKIIIERLGKKGRQGRKQCLPFLLDRKKEE